MTPLIYDVPILETERLTLRQFQDQDGPAFARLNADPEVRRFLGEGVPLDEEESWRLMATIVGHWVLRGYGFWVVEEKSTRTFLGRVGLWYPLGWPGLEIGWAISREYWRQGFAKESASAVMDYAFRVMKVPELISLIVPANEPSIRVATSLGMSFARTHSDEDGEMYIYKIDRPTFLSA